MVSASWSSRLTGNRGAVPLHDSCAIIFLLYGIMSAGTVAPGVSLVMLVSPAAEWGPGFESWVHPLKFLVNPKMLAAHRG